MIAKPGQAGKLEGGPDEDAAVWALFNNLTLMKAVRAGYINRKNTVIMFEVTGCE